MIEFVMVMPFLALIFALIWFFGDQMKNQQQVKVATRYNAWRHVRTESAVGITETAETSLEGRAEWADVDRGTGQSQTRADLVTAASDISDRAGEMADILYLDRFPRARRVDVQAEWPYEAQLWELAELDGAIEKRHVREGVEWRRHQARLQRTLIDLFLEDLEGALNSVEAPGSGMAQMMRRLYHQGW